MILIDDRVGSKELLPLIQAIGIPCQLLRLEYGDACFDGNGPKGPITIGVERKTLNDMLSCIDDARYSAYQRPGMLKMYSKSFVCLEGLWTTGQGNGYTGILMQGYRRGQSWGPLKTRGNRQVLYSKLYRYMLSVSLSGVIITPSIDICHTAFNICEMYQYFQKKWQQHTSLIEVQKLAIPSLDGKPGLTRRWASEINDIGPKLSIEAEQLFRTPKRLALADESEWLRIPGLGVPTARRIVKEINGWR